MIAAPPGGGFAFYRPDGTALPASPGLPEPEGSIEDTHDADISPDTIIPSWYGERLDLDHALYVCLANARTEQEKQACRDQAQKPLFEPRNRVSGPSDWSGYFRRSTTNTRPPDNPARDALTHVIVARLSGSAPVPAGDHHRRIRRTLRQARLNDDPGFGSSRGRAVHRSRWSAVRRGVEAPAGERRQLRPVADPPPGLSHQIFVGGVAVSNSAMAAQALAAAAARRHPVEVARGWPAVPGEAFGHRAANLLRAVGGHLRSATTQPRRSRRRSCARRRCPRRWPPRRPRQPAARTPRTGRGANSAKRSAARLSPSPAPGRRRQQLGGPQHPTLLGQDVPADTPQGWVAQPGQLPVLGNVPQRPNAQRPAAVPSG